MCLLLSTACLAFPLLAVLDPPIAVVGVLLCAFLALWLHNFLLVFFHCLSYVCGPTNLNGLCQWLMMIIIPCLILSQKCDPKRVESLFPATSIVVPKQLRSVYSNTCPCLTNLDCVCFVDIIMVLIISIYISMSSCLSMLVAVFLWFWQSKHLWYSGWI